MDRIYKQKEEGSSYKRNVAHQEHLVRIAGNVMDIDRFIEEATEKRPLVYEFKIKCEPDDEEGVLIMLKGYTPDGYVVAFHREDTVWEALAGIGKRLRNNSLKWKTDEYPPAQNK